VESTPAGNVTMAAPQEVIDQFVYELYGLTGEEIRIVEDGSE